MEKYANIHATYKVVPIKDVARNHCAQKTMILTIMVMQDDDNSTVQSIYTELATWPKFSKSRESCACQDRSNKQQRNGHWCYLHSGK